MPTRPPLAIRLRPCGAVYVMPVKVAAANEFASSSTSLTFDNNVSYKLYNKAIEKNLKLINTDS